MNLKYRIHVICFVKTNLSLPIAFAAIVAFALVFAVAPSAMADYGDDGAKSYKRHWAVPIGDAKGTLQITEDTDKADLKEKVISLGEIADDYDNVVKARLGKAVNDSGEYYLVWKLVSINYDEDSDTKTFTVNVLDAGNGNLLTTMTKEGGHCGDKDKSDTTPTSGESA